MQIVPGAARYRKKKKEEESTSSASARQLPLGEQKRKVEQNVGEMEESGALSGKLIIKADINCLANNLGAKKKSRENWGINSSSHQQIRYQRVLPYPLHPVLMLSFTPPLGEAVFIKTNGSL